MKKILLLLFSFCFCSLAKAQNTFEKVIDTLGSYAALSVQQTFDEGYIFCGSSSYNGGDVVIVKFDSLGSIEWAKNYSGPGAEGAVTLFQTPDTGYIVNALYDISLNSLNWLLRLDVNGDTIWTKTYSAGTGATNASQMAIEKSNAMYGLTGYFQPQMSGVISAFLIATLNTGFSFVNKIYSLSLYGNDARAIDVTSDNGFIMTGTIGTSSSHSDLYLIRTNTFGDTLWTRYYDNSTTEAGTSVEQTTDGGFIVAGYTYDTTFIKDNAYLLKTDSVGDTLWTQQFGDSISCSFNCVQQTSDGGYIATGRIVNGIPLAGHLYLVKTDSLGDTLWTRQFGNAPDGSGTYVRQTGDKGFIISGQTFNNNGPVAYIIKIDSVGNMLTGLSSAEINHPSNFIIFPNPTSGVFIIKTAGLPRHNLFLEIYNVNNQCVYTCNINNKSSEQINLSNAPNGIYIALIRTSKKIFTQKFIILK